MPDGRGFSWDVVPVSAWDADATDDELHGLKRVRSIAASAGGARRRRRVGELRLQTSASSTATAASLSFA